MRPRFSCWLLASVALLGALSATACDEQQQPRLHDVTVGDDTADGLGPYVISAVVHPTTPSDALALYYSLDTGAHWDSRPMRRSAGTDGRYVGTIDPMDPTQLHFFFDRPWAAGTEVWFYLELQAANHAEQAPPGAPDGPAFAFVIGSEVPLRLLELTPASGPASGGQMVFVRGRGFTADTRLRFGQTVATTEAVPSSEFMRVITPAGSGLVDLRAERDDGATAVLPAAYQYLGSTPCVRDTDCPDGLVCRGGTCSPAPDCLRDADCPAGQLCEAGRCRNNAFCDTISCPPGLFCDAARRQCIECVSATHCPAGTVCLDGFCSGECDANRPCPPGSVCRFGVCEPGQVCDGVVCPTGWRCDPRVGGCVPDDLCGGIACPPGTACDPASGLCVPQPACSRDAQCDDGRVCNGTERCRDGRCSPGQPPACEAPDPCFVTYCAESMGGCVGELLPDGVPCPGGVCLGGACRFGECFDSWQCNDGDACNGAETCVNGVCSDGQPVTCNDGNPCTADACEPSGRCRTVPITDGTACGNGRSCMFGICVPSACTTNAVCADGLACNGAELCFAGQCIPGATTLCDDDDPCTIEQCVEPTGACSRRPAPDGTPCADGRSCVSGACGGPLCGSDADCSNGRACDGLERCTGTGCAAGAPILCDDGNPCTAERCEEPFGLCAVQVLPNGSPCGANGQVCLAGRCESATCGSPADCADGLACNGAEACTNGACVPGRAVLCNDGNPCTSERCVEPSGGCAVSRLADGTPCGMGGRVCQGGVCTNAQACFADDDCDDGIGCNGDELCFPPSCLPGQPRNCSGLVGPCRVPACLEDGSPDGACSGTPVRDGTSCSGTGVCTAGQCTHDPGECRSNDDCLPPAVCNPFSARCEPSQGCQTDGDCGPGLICVGGTCASIQGCVSSGDCPPGTVCWGNICHLAPSCYSDLDCAPDEQCDGWSCQPIVCSSDADCLVDWACRASRCIPPAYCSVDADCPLSGLQCVNYTCQNPGGCQADSQCPVNQFCLWGACFFLPPTQCGRDEDCGASQFCYLGYCQPTP